MDFHCRKQVTFWSGLSLAILLVDASEGRFLSSSSKDEDTLPNVLFISIDDLRNDMGALGVEHAHTPNLDDFAAQSRLFSRHYVAVPSCGPSRAALIRGKRPTASEYLPNSAIRNTHNDWGEYSLPAWFRQHGYTTLSLGKVTHHPGGLTGEGWAEGPEELPGAWDHIWVPDSPWETPLDMMHGYANGVPRERGVSPAWEAYDGPDEAYPDAWVANDAVEMLKKLVEQDDPWFFAVGFFKPHLPFAAPQKWFDIHDPEHLYVPEDTVRYPVPASWSPGIGTARVTDDGDLVRHPSPSSWHPSRELMNNYGQHPGHPQNDKDYARLLRHGYAAATSYMDAQIGRVLDVFDQLGLDDNTIVVIWSDHGFALGEQGIWGKHSLYEVALKCPLMIRYPGMDHKGEISEAVVETIDIYPTLTDLAGIPEPDGLHGKSLRPQLEDARATSKKPAFGFANRGQTTIRTNDWRLIVHRSEGEDNGYELFDFRDNPNGERVEPKDEQTVVEKLMQQINALPWHNIH